MERTPLIGRTAELAVIEDAITGTVAGHGQALFLFGEAGIGKTRLTLEAEALAAEHGGVLAARGECYESAGAPPYWPWIQIVRGLADQHGTARSLPSEITSRATRLLDQLGGALLASDPAAVPVAAGQARFMLFDAAASLFGEAARRAPVLLILEDLHWADEASLALGTHILANIASTRMLVVATCRTPQPDTSGGFSRFLSSLTREPLASAAQSLNIRGLKREEVRDWISRASGHRAAEENAPSIFSRTDGNPLFVGEMIKLLGTESKAHADAIPETIRNAVRARLSGLSRACAGVLEIACVLGPEIPPWLVARLDGDRPLAEVLELLDEAAAAGMLQDHSDSAGTHRFRHAIIQQTIRSTLSSARRGRLHAATAIALEAEGLAPAAQLAYHFAEGRPFAGSDKLIHYARVAGEHALEAYAWAEAIDHFQSALSASTGSSAHEDEEVAAAWFGLGRAQSATYRFSEAWASMAMAFDLYASLDDVPNLVRVATFPLSYVPGTQGVVRRMELALSRVSDESVEAARLLARYGRLLTMTGATFDEANTAIARALAIARRRGDVRLEFQGLCDAIDIDMNHLRWDELLRHFDRAMALGQRARDLRSEVWIRLAAAVGLTFLGRARDEMPHLTMALAATERPDLSDLRERACHFTEIAFYALGQWREASVHARKGLEASPDAPNLVAWETLREFEQGHVESGLAGVEKLLNGMSSAEPAANMHHVAAALALPVYERWVARWEWLDAAENAARIVLGSPDATPLLTLSAHTGLAHCAVARNDATAAEREYEALKPYAGTYASAMCSADRLLGLTAFAAGRQENAFRHLRDAVSWCRTAAYGPELAWTCHDFATLSLESGRLDQMAEAASLLIEGQTIAEEIGMKVLGDRLAVLRVRLNKVLRGQTKQASLLTARQLDVLRLIAQGRTNQEIADQLVISLNTVLRHVTNIFVRIGVSNRAEAAAFAASHGLLLEIDGQPNS